MRMRCVPQSRGRSTCRRSVAKGHNNPIGNYGTAMRVYEKNIRYGEAEFSGLRHSKEFGAVVDKLQSAPFFQDGKLLVMGSIIKSKFGFFQEPVELLGWNTVIFTQHAFGLVPKIFNPVDMTTPLCKHFGMIDPVMPEF